MLSGASPPAHQTVRISLQATATEAHESAAGTCAGWQTAGAPARCNDAVKAVGQAVPRQSQSLAPSASEETRPTMALGAQCISMTCIPAMLRIHHGMASAGFGKAGRDVPRCGVSRIRKPEGLDIRQGPFL